MNNLVLITGGAKSGKSEFAESIAVAAKLPVIYLATMPIIAGDGELKKKIERHQMRRPSNWQTIESETNLAYVLQNLPPQNRLCLIDCLSLYVANLLHHYEQLQALSEEEVLGQCRQLITVMERSKHLSFVAVTNEVGSGIVPENALARLYRDLLGQVNKEFAASSHTVWLCCAGLPIKIKPSPN